MNLVVSLEHRFDRTPDGVVWTQTQFAYSFWTRYLAVFDQVRVLARICDVPSVPADAIRSDGEGVSFAAVPYYIGPWQYLMLAQQVKRSVRNAIGSDDAVLMRIGSQLARCMEPVLRRTGHPYGVEVVTDPYEVFKPGSVKHPLRPFFRWWFPWRQRRQCTGACAAAYVTEHTLQRRYPAAPGAFSTYYSDVELPLEAFASGPRAANARTFAFTLITVGSLAQLYKAPHILIDTVAICLQEGLDLKLVLVGDGKYRTELEQQVARHGLQERISFRGQLQSGKAVRDELDRADLFVLPSFVEGLPRALIEAMARALPCIGSTVGGFPELLPPDDMVPPGDAPELARKIREVVMDPERMARMSTRNLEKAKAYGEELLRERRTIFYRHLRSTTEAWLAAQQR